MGELGELVPQAPRSHSKSSFANSRHVPQIPAQDSRTVSPFPADFRFFPPNLAVSRSISRYLAVCYPIMFPFVPRVSFCCPKFPFSSPKSFPKFPFSSLFCTFLLKASFFFLFLPSFSQNREEEQPRNAIWRQDR